VLQVRAMPGATQVESATYKRHLTKNSRLLVSDTNLILT
jgi:hypothetical protein